MSIHAYQSRRRREALPRWQRIFEMRTRGMKFREIAERTGISIPRLFRVVEGYREHLINSKLL